MDPPFAPIPTKTPLGVEEQRKRTAGLGQRHRTILFLVDGRRPLGEVLRLAQQAGASVQHFEDLVHLGHVEVPRAPEPPPLPAEEPLAVVAEVALHAVALGPEPAPEPDAEVADGSAVANAAPAGPAPAQPWMVDPVLPSLALDLAPSAPAPPLLPVLGEVAVPRFSGAPLVPVGPPPWRARTDVPAPLSREDEKILGAARARLLEALKLDPPMFSRSLTTRVRGAKTAPVLVDLTLEIERLIDRRRRSSPGLAALEAARELLGLGNTVIADEDSRPTWADTE